MPFIPFGKNLVGCRWQATITFLNLNRQRSNCVMRRMWSSLAAALQGCMPEALAKADVRITLIDKRNFNLFQPLLYQVATGLVSRSDVATPLRELVGRQENVQVLLGEVTTVNPEGKQIVLTARPTAMTI